eukprot:2190894-Amphidinium_carterae.1
MEGWCLQNGRRQNGRLVPTEWKAGAYIQAGTRHAEAGAYTRGGTEIGQAGVYKEGFSAG